jgi:hypothetical protein
MEMLNFSKAMSDAVEGRLLRLRDEIAQSINSHGLTASGRTAQSMRVVTEGNEVALWGRAFFPALETGSSRWTGYTGIRCTFAQFRDIIRDWVTAKGLNFGQHKEHERTIGAITAKIIREGTRQKRSGSRLDVYTTLVDQAFEDCGEIVRDVVNAQVDNVIAQWK